MGAANFKLISEKLIFFWGGFVEKSKVKGLKLQLHIEVLLTKTWSYYLDSFSQKLQT